MNRDTRGSRRKPQPSHKPKQKRRKGKQTKDSTKIDEHDSSGIGEQNIEEEQPITTAAVRPKSPRELNPKKIHSAQTPRRQWPQHLENNRVGEFEKQRDSLIKAGISSGNTVSSSAHKSRQEKKYTSVEVQTDTYDISGKRIYCIDGFE